MILNGVSKSITTQMIKTIIVSMIAIILTKNKDPAIGNTIIHLKHRGCVVWLLSDKYADWVE